MNYRVVIKYLGIISGAVSGMFIPAMLWAIWFGEYRMLIAFSESSLTVAGFGVLLWVTCRKSSNKMLLRDSLALVGFSWLLIAAWGALPFIYSGTLGWVDAYFESMSGFTTTGASILTDIEILPKSLLFWRSFTHWLGGIGIIVLIVIVLPFLGAGGKLLFRSEVAGVDKQGMKPRISDSAFILAKIYCFITLIQTLLLLVAGMSLFEALCHTFGTLATGGYSTRNASIAAYNSFPIELIIMTFMLIGGTNFGIYNLFINGKWKEALKNSEWHLFLGVVAVSTLLIALNLSGVQGVLNEGAPEGGTHVYQGFFHSIRVAAFQTISCMTTTGFATADFDTWPQFSRILLVFLMLIGGCSGSTSGGIKVMRFLLITKIIYIQIRKTFQPKTIHVLRVQDTIINDEIQKALLAFFAIYVFVFLASSLLLALLGLPSETAFSAVAATINGVGPGLQLVGAVRNFAFIPDAGKLLLSFVMLLGRLEFLTIMVLFVPAFWKRT